MLDDFGNQPAVDSPDGRKSVQLTSDGNFRVFSGRAVIAARGLPDVMSNIEIGWSPDSTQFFVSYSNGGETGGYQVYMYRLNGSALTESTVPDVVAKRFRAKHWCEFRENNLFFPAWTPDSKVAFLVTEVYPTGDCRKEAGTFKGYSVDTASAKVLRVFGEKQTQAIEKKCRVSGALTLPNWLSR